MRYIILAFVLTVLIHHVIQAQSVADSSDESDPKGKIIIGGSLDMFTRDVSSVNNKLTEKGFPVISNYNLPVMSIYMTVDYYGFIYQLKLPLHLIHNPLPDKYGYSGGSVGSYSNYKTFMITELGYTIPLLNNYLSVQPGFQVTFGRVEFGVAQLTYTNSIVNTFHQTSTRLDFAVGPTLNLNYYSYEKSKRLKSNVTTSFYNLHIGYNLSSLDGVNNWYSPDWFTDSVPWLTTDDLKQRGLNLGISAGVYW